jgi:hypothetical protein
MLPIYDTLQVVLVLIISELIEFIKPRFKDTLIHGYLSLSVHEGEELLIVKSL